MAPAMPGAPPTMAIFSRVPLCASAAMRGSVSLNHDASTSCIADAASRACAPSPMSTTTMSPHAPRATSCPRFTVPKVNVSAARSGPTFCPVLASSPVGTSSATIDAPRVASAHSLSTASATSPRSAPSAEKPVPSSASTTRSSPPESRSSIALVATTPAAIATSRSAMRVRRARGDALDDAHAHARRRAARERRPIRRRRCCPAPWRRRTPRSTTSPKRRTSSAATAAPARCMSARDGMPLAIAAASQAAAVAASTTATGGWRELTGRIAWAGRPGRTTSGRRRRCVRSPARRCRSGR